MAARPLPEVASRTLTISPEGTVDSHQYLRVGPLDSICFDNTADFPVNITFTSVFQPIEVVQHSTSPEQGGVTSLKVTINYRIYNAETGKETGGPYAVDFGDGAMTISISGSTPSPEHVAIPAGGKIAFDSDVDYKISWTWNGQPIHAWVPDPPQVSHGHNSDETALPVAHGKTLYYDLDPSDCDSTQQSTAIALSTTAGGGGTVKVGS